MAEYIEREAAITVIQNIQGPILSREVGALRTLHAADVAPVVHGPWVGLEYDGYADGCPVYDLWKCSECGEEVRGEDVPDTHPWCHGCGAKMDGEQKDGEG